MVCGNIFTAPPHSNGWRWCFQSWEILNLEVDLNCITGSRVMAILLNGWILPIGGALAVEVAVESSSLARRQNSIDSDRQTNKLKFYS